MAQVSPKVGGSIPPPPGERRERTSLSIPTPLALRQRADRMNAQVARKGTPRRRYIADQRNKVAGRLQATAANSAAITGIVTLLDVLGYGAPTTSLAIFSGAALALVLGLIAISVTFFQKNYDALILLSTAASASLTLGWGLIAHATGGATSPYIMILPFACVGIVGLVPIPPRFSVISAAASYAGLLIASPHAPLYAHIFVLSAGAAAINLAVGRHRAAIRLFMRIERLSAAVERMRRTQEQLVVVEKLEAMRVLVGGMAHELNNALAVSVASNQQAAKTLDVESPAAAAIKRSDGGLTRIRRTVDRIKRFAMSADGVLEPADVGAMLDFALESAIGRARSGVIIERTYDVSVGQIECHVAALAEALFQVARNAVEAMPRGGTINASVRAEGDRVILGVADEGDGIPADQLARVFDPFYSRGGAGAANKSGLGLSAVYGLVSALGGRVEIHSEVGKGTEVAIIMPRKNPTLSRPPPPIAGS
jgi:signal transduction histidine kinase